MNSLLYFIFTKSIGLYLNWLYSFHPKKAITLTYNLFCRPKKGKLHKSKLPSFLQNAKKETLDQHNEAIPTYIWEGNNTKIVLIHGWESNAARWENLVQYLHKTGSTIIAIDAPAHGLNNGKEFSIPKYSQFIHKTVQKYNPQYLIGHSIGGKTCLYYQHIFPSSSIQKIVILGAPCDFKIILDNYIKLLNLNPKLAKHLFHKCTQEYNIELDEFSVQKFVTNCKIKGLIIHDIEDQTVSINEGIKIANAWKNTVFIKTKGLGHSLQDLTVFNQIESFLID